MKQLKVIPYERVATSNGVATPDQSITGQRKALLQYCCEHQLEVAAHFTDVATGKTFDRPGFNDMLKFIGNNEQQVDKILVTRWDRFSRNPFEAIGMKQKLKLIGIEVVAIDQPQTDRIFGDLLQLLLAEKETDYAHPCFKIHKDNMPAFAGVIGHEEIRYSMYSEGDEYIIIDVTYDKLNKREADLIRQLVEIEERQGTANSIVDSWTDKPFA